MPPEDTAVTIIPPRRGWQKGQTGNPGGNPGARRRYVQDFMDDIHDSWKVYGRPVLMTAALTDPVSYLRVCASLIPRDIDITVTHTTAERLSDDDLMRLIEEDAARDSSEAA